MRKAVMFFAAFLIAFSGIILAEEGTSELSSNKGAKTASIMRINAPDRTNTEKNSYVFKITPASSDGRLQGDVIWFAEVFGPEGVSAEGIRLQVDTTDSTKVTVTVQDSVIGDVVLYGRYHTTTGKIVSSSSVVVSRPAGKVMTGISLDLKWETMAVGDMRIPEIWAQYDNGAKSLIFFPEGSKPQITSSNPAVVSVSPIGDLKAQASGSSTISAVYHGFTAQAVLTVSPELCFITASASSDAAGTVSGEQFYPKGTEATVIAIAHAGYVFTNWTEKGQVVSTSPNYTFTVSREQTLAANFSKQKISGQ